MTPRMLTHSPELTALLRPLHSQHKLLALVLLGLRAVALATDAATEATQQPSQIAGQFFDAAMDMGSGSRGVIASEDGSGDLVEATAKVDANAGKQFQLRARKPIPIIPDPKDLIFFDNSPGFPTINGKTDRLKLNERWTGSVRLQYKVMFSDKFEWNSGGQLPGILGGRWWCTPNHRSKNCWSVQLGWGPNGAAELRSKIPQARRNVPRTGSLQFQKNTWYDVIMFVKVNTKKQSNGEVQVWINGKKFGGEERMLFSTRSTRSVYVLQAGAYNDKKDVPLTRSDGKVEYIMMKDFLADQVKKEFVLPPPPPVPSPPPPMADLPPSTPDNNPDDVPAPPANDWWSDMPLPETPMPTGPYVWEELTPDQYRRARQLTSIFENSKLDYQYGFCKDIGDGRGYTFGFCGFTTKYSDSRKVLSEYLARQPGDTEMALYLDKLNNKAKGSDGKAGLEGFCNRVAELGADPDFIAAQEAIQMSEYYGPSKAWSQRLGLRLPISKGEMYDAMINHGEGRGDPFSIDHIVDKTNAAMGGSPMEGADEVRWLDSFLSIRAKTIKDLANWQSKRIDFYRELLREGNLNLDGPIWVQLQDQSGGWTINNVYYGKFDIYSDELSEMRDGTLGLIA